MIAKPLGANIYKEWLKMCDYVSHSLGYSCLFSRDVKMCVALSVRLSRHTAVHPLLPHQARNIGL